MSSLVGVRAAPRRAPSLLLGLWLAWRAECCTTTCAVAVPAPLAGSSATASSALLFFFPTVGLARAARVTAAPGQPGRTLL